jgi:hypothetical protein
MAHADEIALLERFKKLILEHKKLHGDESSKSRSEINRAIDAVRTLLIEAGALQTFTIAPPPAVGGLVMRDVDLMNHLFNPPYRMDVTGSVVDMLDTAIGRIENGALDQTVVNVPEPRPDTKRGYAFVAMAIASDDAQLDDVLDAIQEAAKTCDIMAERIDQQVSNERITDRILEAIRVAEFVVVDLTHAKPNVFYEAGYAQGLGKTPIYIARQGTKLEFDIKDYPVIFFDSLRVLKHQLAERLRKAASDRV